MQLIDAHAHVFTELAGFGAEGELRAIGGGKAVWATGNVINLIPEGYGDTSFPAESYLRIMDAHHIGKAVLLQGGFLGFENRYLHDVVGKYPDRFAVAGTFDPYCRSADAILDHLLAEGFRIFKFEMSTGCGIMGNKEKFLLDEPKLMHFYARIAEKDGMLAFDLGSPGDDSNQPGAVAAIAKYFPSMKITVCHLMSVRLHQKQQLEEGLALMNRENIHFDLAALHHKVRPEAYPFPTAQEYIQIAKKLVGCDRLMWGTDAPSTLSNYSLEHLLEYQWACFSDDEREKVFSDNAKTWYFE